MEVGLYVRELRLPVCCGHGFSMGILGSFHNNTGHPIMVDFLYLSALSCWRQDHGITNYLGTFIWRKHNKLARVGYSESL